MSIGPTPEQTLALFIFLMMGLGMLVFLRVLTIYRAHELINYKKALAVQQARAKFLSSSYNTNADDDSVIEVGADDMGDVILAEDEFKPAKGKSATSQAASAQVDDASEKTPDKG